MAEKENVVVEKDEAIVEEQTAPAEVVAEETADVKTEAPNKKDGDKPGFKAKVKEWFRKQIVTLKRKPQRIPFLFFIVASVMYLIGLGVTSPGPVKDFSGIPLLGLSVFIVTLLSILVLVLFMNTFPKRGIRYKKTGKKHNMNYVMLGLTFVFVAVMIVFDVIYFKHLTVGLEEGPAKFFKTLDDFNSSPYKKYCTISVSEATFGDGEGYRDYLVPALNLTIAHIVFLGIGSVLLATLPLYRKLILKINTAKVIEDNDIKETIDTEDE